MISTDFFNNLSYEGIKLTQWKYNEALGTNNLTFRFGTVHGMFGKFSDENTLELVAIGNDKKGNGDFNKAMDWYESLAKSLGYRPAVVEIWNEKLRTHLISKRGYTPYSIGVVKND